MAPRSGSSNVPTHPILPALPPIALRRAPYVFHATTTVAQTTWRTTLAQRWVQWHIALALAALVGALTLIMAAGENVAGFWLGSFAIGGIALCAAGLRALEYGAPGAAAILMFVCDAFAIVAALALLGAQPEILALLPGTLLITVILVEPIAAIAGSVVCFLAYLLVFFQGSPARLELDGQALLSVHLTLLLGGGLLFLVALSLTAAQLRRALAGEAALQQALLAAERRAAYKRARIDADAIALQRMLANTLRGGTSAPVASGEDLAPLANMINAVAGRLPGLLRDREQRLQLERALDQTITALERAWGGFDWAWPTPSGTLVDHLITLLQPTTAQRDVS